jgi:hypothetical protein
MQIKPQQAVVNHYGTSESGCLMCLRVVGHVVKSNMLESLTVLTAGQLTIDTNDSACNADDRCPWMSVICLWFHAACDLSLQG